MRGDEEAAWLTVWQLSPQDQRRLAALARAGDPASAQYARQMLAVSAQAARLGPICARYPQLADALNFGLKWKREAVQRQRRFCNITPPGPAKQDCLKSLAWMEAELRKQEQAAIEHNKKFVETCSHPAAALRKAGARLLDIGKRLPGDAAALAQKLKSGIADRLDKLRRDCNALSRLSIDPNPATVPAGSAKDFRATPIFRVQLKPRNCAVKQYSWRAANVGTVVGAGDVGTLTAGKRPADGSVSATATDEKGNTGQGSAAVSVIIATEDCELVGPVKDIFGKIVNCLYDCPTKGRHREPPTEKGECKAFIRR